ncbi:metallophosphoesterase [Nanobdella aerobiophila]|uniref:Metallophosphoesterase n=1 Tax=Nanobdella aerobiophila TaxID=2586965 RepID=A0A915SKP5_9ARCH|nr:metallophosphoesterase [Nanobdella aerobiophila]BBL45481.1 metallophosphoesterase [Nanobdella aerobiophila]
MKILVSSDLHLPYNMKEIYDSINKIDENIDIIILAGDIIDNKQHIYLKKIYYMLNQKFNNKKIFSTFGNNEASFLLDDKNYKDYYKKEYNSFIWLDYDFYDLGDYYIVGFEGFPDRTWKLSNISEIKKYYISKLRSIFEKLDKKIIVFSHYGLSRDTVLGDPGPLWALYSPDIQNLIEEYSDKIIIGFHGHVHQAANIRAKLNNTEIYNVAFPIHKRFLIFEV